MGWIGPIVVALSTLVGWFAFVGARGEDGDVTFGLFIGSASIVLMAWSFVLAIRLRVLEPLFGGLDTVYRVHRWAGTLAVVAMWLHTANEPEVEGGIRGAAENVAEAATDLAGTGETIIYVLIAITLLRWVPYRFWRLTHKLLGIPFAFACWHFFTAEKPYANTDPWGLWFNAFMIAGLAAFAVRVVARDVLARGVRHRIVSADTTGTTTALVLEPVGRRLLHRAGQFAFIKIQARGMSEPHAFTIASHPSDRYLRFFVRDLGDWSGKLHAGDWIGTDVLVEGPYGTFEATDPDKAHILWLAGGVGITPFLAALGGLDAAPPGRRPTLIYSTRRHADATAIEVLEAAATAGKVDLHVYASADGNRLTAEAFRSHIPSDAGGTHVAMCGPSGLIADMAATARAAGVHAIETEDFDIRQGFGPDLSVALHDLASRRRPRT
jgi:predicted ferric reductase